MNRLTETVFDTGGLVFPAFTLVAFAIGAFLGMLFRRVIPALAATLGVYLVLRLGAWALRGQYPVAVVTSNAKLFARYETPSLPGYPWILSTWFTGPGGKPVSPSGGQRGLDRTCPSRPDRCRRGYTEWFRYIPLSHYWPMQFIEAGWLLVLALALIGAATRLAGPPPGRLTGPRRQPMTVFTAARRPRPDRDAGPTNRGRCRGRECCGSPGGSTGAC